jgi:hypothetical protein
MDKGLPDITSQDCELWLFKVPSKDKFDIASINNTSLGVGLSQNDTSQIIVNDRQFSVCVANPAEYTHLVNLWPSSASSSAKQKELQLKLGKPFQHMVKIVEMFDLPKRKPLSSSATNHSSSSSGLNRLPTLAVRNYPPGVIPNLHPTPQSVQEAAANKHKQSDKSGTAKHDSVSVKRDKHSEATGNVKHKHKREAVNPKKQTHSEETDSDDTHSKAKKHKYSQSNSSEETPKKKKRTLISNNKK